VQAAVAAVAGLCDIGMVADSSVKDDEKPDHVPV
jgi:hypothetical protein